MAEYDPWGLSGPIRNIGGILAQTPRLRAEAEAARQRGQLTEAQIGTEGAQAEHYRAQTRQRDAETGGMQSDQAGDAKRAEAMRRLAVNPNDAEALAVMLEESGRAMRRNPDKEIQGISRLLAMFRSLGATNLQGADPVGLATAAGHAVPMNSGVDAETMANARGHQINLAGVNNASREGIADRSNVNRLGIAALNNVSRERIASMNPPQPKSSAVEQERARLMAALAKLDAQNNTTNAPGAIKQFDQLAGQRPGSGATLDKEMAAQLLKEAGGDKALARQLAAQRGYTF